MKIKVLKVKNGFIIEINGEELCTVATPEQVQKSLFGILKKENKDLKIEDVKIEQYLGEMVGPSTGEKDGVFPFKDGGWYYVYKGEKSKDLYTKQWQCVDAYNIANGSSIPARSKK